MTVALARDGGRVVRGVSMAVVVRAAVSVKAVVVSEW